MATPVIKNIYDNRIIDADFTKTGNDFIYDLAEKTGLNGLLFENVVFKNITPDFIASMRDCTFKNCEFINCDFDLIYFQNAVMDKCKFSEGTDFSKKLGITFIGGKQKPILKPTNEEIEKKHHCKVVALPNKSFVKIKWTCDFCHKEWYEIYRRDRVNIPLLAVPNCNKRVCENCYSTYRLSDKFEGNRTYGYHGTVHKYKTPMDSQNTAIIGLEMEFEGDFYGWKELQDAHQGMLHYGYDSSVIGQNELSWDCGSYSWWKYLAPLKNVCEVLAANGGKPGDSAGIHIHVSRPDVNMKLITEKVNSFGRTPEGKALFEAISLRSNKERFERYSNLEAPCGTHHSGISYNSYGTCEFRLFNSSLDYKLILKHIKFCKEVFNSIADYKPLWKNFSKETVAHIKDCAKAQFDKGFITEEQYNLILKNLK